MFYVVSLHQRCETVYKPTKNKTMKNLIRQIRIKEIQINKLEEIVGNYPTEEKQIKLSCLHSELRELKKKIVQTN